MSVATKKPVILSVTVERLPDESPDLSHLGDFSNDASGWSVDRKTGILSDDVGNVLADGLGATMERNEFRFISGFQHADDVASWDHVSDSGVNTAYLRIRYLNNGKPGRRCNGFADMGVVGWATAQSRADKIRVISAFYCCDDARRLEDHGNGWNMIGIRAVAEIRMSDGTTQTIHSGGLWGIESDSDASYFNEIETEQLGELASNLQELGFTATATERAIAKAKRPH